MAEGALESNSDPARLLADLCDGCVSPTPDLLERFWSGVRAGGTPLVEPIEGDSDFRRVTFLWRGERDTEHVILAGALADGRDPGEILMARIPDSDIWYATHRLRSDTRLHYGFSPHQELEANWHLRQWSVRPDPANAARLDWPKNEADPATPEVMYSILELEDAPPQHWLEPSGYARGTVELFSSSSRHL